MKSDIERLGALRVEGEAFTYQNFSSKSERGYPASPTPAWVNWTTRVESAVIRLLGPESAPLKSLQYGLNVPLMGNGPDKFSQAHAYIIGALKAAEQILSEKGQSRSPVSGASPHSKRVFIVHGHDDKSKSELELLLSELGLEPIVLHRQPDEGRTVIEKFEKYSDVGYAFILLTPDDISYSAADISVIDSERRKEYRARPNVIFEFGYFVGKLGRGNVCCLYTGDTTLPSDVHGVLYKKFVSSIEEVAYAITKELKAKNYQLK
jgi:predicted nucleotide-binding protein